MQYATVAGSFVARRASKSPRRELDWWIAALAGLLFLIPVMLWLLREVFTNRWNPETGPFHHFNLYWLMTFGDSSLVVMLVFIGWFELLVWRSQLIHAMPEAIRIWLYGWPCKAALIPYFFAGQRILEHVNEPRNEANLQAAVFDIYHDAVAGLTLHQLTVFTILLSCMVWRQRRRLFADKLVILAGLGVFVMLAIYIVIWMIQPERIVIEHGFSINTGGFGQWVVPRLFSTPNP